MRLEADRYRVLRRQPDGGYLEIRQSEFFVLKRKDMNSVPALQAYALSASDLGDDELADDVIRVASTWEASKDAKLPD